MRAVEEHKKTVNFRCPKKKMVARCREIIESWQNHGENVAFLGGWILQLFAYRYDSKE